MPLNDGSSLFSDDPKSDSMEVLIEKTLTAKHLLTFNEAMQDVEMIQPNFYAFYYGSFSEAAQIAWSKVETILLRDNHDDKEEKSTVPKYYTTEEVRAKLAAYYDKHGRIPKQIEVMGDPELPSWFTMLKHLGPKTEWEKQVQAFLSSTDQAECAPQDTDGKISVEVSENIPKNNGDDMVKIETPEHCEGTGTTIEIRLTLPNRKPISITLTV